MPPFDRLGFVSVHVSSLEVARPFYEKVLGLRVLLELPPEEGEVFYDLGGMPLSVHVDPNGECGRKPGGETGFYMQVADVDAAARALEEAGGRIAWREGRTLGVLDPDGNGYVLWQPKGEWPPRLS